jgi:hypothetical protein
MPQAAPPLGDEQIALIEKWIAEGAAFDGDDPETPVGTLAALAEARGLDENGLAARRRELATRNWQLVFPGEQPNIAETSDFQLVTGVAAPARERLLDRLDQVAMALRETLDHPSGQPLVRGRITVFALGRQYDFAEFGRMVLGRETGANSPALWQFDGVDAWVAILVTNDTGDELLDALLASNLSAVQVASLTPRVPRWFADGIGLVMAERSLDKNSIMREWQAVAAATAAQFPAPGAIRDPSTPGAAAALGSYGFFREALPNPAGLRRVLERLAGASGFAEGFHESFGAAPEAVLPDRQPGQGRNR